MEATLYSGLEIIGGASENTRKLIFAPPPSSSYNRFSEKLRKNIPTELQCALFCGGRRCKYEQSSYWKKNEMAIEGVFSHWVTDRILAMARPNTQIVFTKNVVGQFKRLGILSLISLQQPGEHSRCGPPLENSGLTYDPEIFMREGISFYNYCMKDYGEASDSRILDMVKVMSFALNEGKVAIHCHAGLGRTGVLIACYLIFHLKVSANQAIQYVRSRRPNSIQTRGQIQCCQNFERYMLSLCDVFSNRDGAQDRKNQEITISNYIKKQQLILHGYECKHFKFIPKIIFVLSERLIELAGKKAIHLTDRWLPFSEKYLVAEPSLLNMEIISRLSESSLLSYNPLEETNDKCIDHTRSNRENQKELTNVKEISFATLQSFPSKPCPNDKDDNIKISPKKAKNVSLNKNLQPQWKRSSDPIICFNIIGKDCMKILHTKDVNILNDTKERKVAQTFPIHVLKKKEGKKTNKEFKGKSETKNKQKASDKEINLTSEENFKTPNCELYSEDSIMDAIVCDHSQLKDEDIERLNKWKARLTHQPSSWNSLEKEKNAIMLSGLLFEWLEHLHKPVLGKDELSYIVILGHKPVMCLKKFPPELQFTIEYLLRLVYRIYPNNKDYQYKFLRRLMASLTHQTIMIDCRLRPVGKGFSKLREGTLRKVLEFGTSFIELLSSQSHEK